LHKIVDAGFRVIDTLLVLMLGIMVVMVFANVVLRYGFGSGITVYEEVSRFLFLWVTFLGAVSVMRQRGHLGFDVVFMMLPRLGRRVCHVVSDILMLGSSLVFLWGAWRQTILNSNNFAPVSGIPISWVYGSAVASAIGLSALLVADLIGAVFFHAPDESFVAEAKEP
jgi:TRAP-type C4-dicarboxylate transport system permease small subunit